MLPKYGFPVDVVPLDLARTGDAEAARLELDRDLKIAIAEYAPGAEVVAAKALWLSEGLKVQAGREWPRRHWGVCKRCRAVRQGLTSLPEECQVCHSTDVDQFASGEFVIPVFGFRGRRSTSKPGDSRPLRLWTTESHFSEYQDEVPDLVAVPGLSAGGYVTQLRSSRQGRITVLNRGPGKRGYQVCSRCGYAEPAPPPGTKSGRRGNRAHHDIRRSKSVDCSGWLTTAYLGHEYLTDVVEIRPSIPMTEEVARSTLYALLEGVAVRGIKRDEVDGTLFAYQYGEPNAFIMFDTVPGGAGHAQLIAREVVEIARAGLGRVSECECGPETSCYQCLRSYSNQLWHESLSRGAAANVLSRLLRE